MKPDLAPSSRRKTVVRATVAFLALAAIAGGTLVVANHGGPKGDEGTCDNNGDNNDGLHALGPRECQDKCDRQNGPDVLSTHDDPKDCKDRCDYQDRPHLLSNDDQRGECKDPCDEGQPGPTIWVRGQDHPDECKDECPAPDSVKTLGHDYPKECPTPTTSPPKTTTSPPPSTEIPVFPSAGALALGTVGALGSAFIVLRRKP